MNSLFLRDLCAALVLSFGHFLWIGTLIAVVAAIAVRRQRTAEARYRVWLAALMAMAVSPFVALAVLQSMPTAVPVVIKAEHSPAEPPPEKRSATDDDRSADERLVNPPLSVDETIPVGGLKRDRMLPDDANTATNGIARPTPPSRESAWWRDYAPLVMSLYLIGVALMGLRLSLGLWGGRRLRRKATPITDAFLLVALQRQATALGMRFIPVLAYCERVAVPTVLGILKPMILLPVSLASGLAPDQIESVLAHELAHLRRYDHLVNLMQCVIESVLFFHPAIWWVSRRIRDEREHCCDDLVVACGAVPLDYAASLLRVAELSREAELQRGHTRRRSFAAVSLFATGDRPSTLRQRIARLLGYQTEMNVRAVHPWLLFCLATCCLGAVWVLTSMTWIVLAEINRDRSQTTVVVEWSALVDESVLNEIRALNGNSPRPASETGAETIRCSADELRAILRGRLGDKKLVTLPSSIRSFWPNDGWSARQRFFTTVAAESIPVGDGFGSVLSVNWHRDGMGTLDERVDGIRLRVDAKYQCQLEGEAPAKPSGKFDELMADGDATVVVVTPPKVPMLFNEVVSDGKGSHAVKMPKGEWKLSAIFVHEAMRLPTDHVELFKPMTTRAEDWIHRGSAGTKEHVARITDWRSRTTQEFATAHNPDWTRELPHGGQIELLGIGHPHLAPLVWWDPTGKPISGDDPNWSDRFPDELIGIVRVSEAGVERCPHADATSNWKLHRIRESQFAKLPMKRVESGEGRITLQVGAGFGSWTAEAQVAPRDGATVNVNGLEFRIAKVFDFSNKRIHAHFHGEPGQDIDVGAVAVTKTGKVVAPHQDPTIASHEVSNGLSFAFEVPLTEIDHLSIKTRPRHWIEFTGFAAEPAVALNPPLEFAKADVTEEDGKTSSEFHPGMTDDQKRELVELRDRVRKIVPKGWQVGLQLGAVSIGRPGRQRDAHWVRWPEATIYFSKVDTTSEMPPIAGRTPIASLGLCKLGYATLSMPQRMMAEWPEYRTQLQSVLPEADDAARQAVQPQESWQVVQGRVRYEDGSPVKGALVGSVGQTKVPVGDDGTYRVQVDPDWGRFFVNLGEARDWPSNNSPPRDPRYPREVLDITVRNHGPPVVVRDITLNRTQLRTVKLLWNGPTTMGRLALYSNPPGDWLTRGVIPLNEKPAGDNPAAVDRERRLLSVSRTLDVKLEHGKQIIINNVPPGDGHLGITLVETLQPLAWPLTGDNEDERLEYDPADTGSVDAEVLGGDGKPLKQPAILLVSRLLPNMSFGVFMTAANDQCELHRPVFDAKTGLHRISHLQPGKYQANLWLESVFGDPIPFEVVKGKSASVVLTAAHRPVGAIPPVEPKSYVAALPDGLKVEFVGITKNTAPAKEGWKPDGLPLGEDVGYWPSTTYRSGHTTGSYIENGEHPEPNAGALDLLFRFRGLKAQPSFRFDLAANGSSYSHLPVKDPYEIRITTERRSPLPGGKWTIPDGEMRIGLTDEPWGKWLQVSPTGEVLNPLTAGDLYRSSYEQVQIERVEPHERAPNKLALVLRQPKNSSLYAFEIRGIDTEDKQQWVLEWEGRGVEGTDLNESRWGLASPEAKPLVRYEFRLRPYRHWVTFQGVSLDPGKETDVKVSVESLFAVVKFPPPNREDVRGLDLSRAAMLGYSHALQLSPDQQTPELLVPGASPSDPWKQPKNVFQMPLAEHTWLKYPAGSGHFYIEHRSDGTWQSEQLYGPIDGDPFELLKLDDLFRERLKPGATGGDPRYRLTLMFRTGDPQLIRRAWRWIEPELALKSSDVEKGSSDAEPAARYSDRDEWRSERLESLGRLREALRKEAEAFRKPELSDVATRMREAVAAAEAVIDALNDSVADETYTSVAYLQPKLAAKIPDALWGQPLDGLRLALVPRESIDWSEWQQLPLDTPLPQTITVQPVRELSYQLVVENVSDHEIKLCGYVIGEEIARSLEVLDHNGKPVAINSLHTTIPHFPSYWRLKPGERKLLAMPAVHFLPVSHELPNHRSGYSVEAAPGKYTLRCSMWFGNLDNGRHRHVPGKSEWIGMLTTGSQKITVADARDIGAESEKQREAVVEKWGEPTNGLRARVVPVLSSMSEDAIDPALRVAKFAKTEDVAFVVELENVSDKPIKLLDTRYGEGYGESKGKANSDWFGQFLFSIDLFDRDGKKIERPEVQVIDLDMPLSGALLASLEPGKTHRFLLRPAKWLSPLTQRMERGSYRAVVRYHGLPARVATRIKESRPNSSVLPAAEGNVVTPQVEFEVMPPASPAKAAVGNEDVKKAVDIVKPALVWGESANGLRAAMEFMPRQATYSHGEKLNTKLHVQNVSDKPITMSSHLWLSDLEARVKNDKREPVDVDSTSYSGWTLSSRVTLKPQQVVIYDAGNVGLAISKERAEKFEHVTHRTLVAPVGKYSMQLEGRFGDGGQLKDGVGKVLAPLEGDWVGELKTGAAPLTITEEVFKPLECDIVDAVTGKRIAETKIKKVYAGTFRFIKPNSVDIRDKVVTPLYFVSRMPSRITLLVPDWIMRRTDRDELLLEWSVANHPAYEDYDPPERIPLKQLLSDDPQSGRDSFRTIKLNPKKKADGAVQAKTLPLEFRIAANLPEDGWEPVLPADWEKRSYRDGRLPAGKDHDAGFVWYPLSQPWRSDAAFVVSQSTPGTAAQGNELLYLLSDKPEHGMLMDGSWSVLEAKVVPGKRKPAPGEELGYAINVRLDDAGEKRFAELVSSYRDMSLAVVMNGEIVGKLLLKKPSARLEFGGHFTKEWAEELARQLNGLPPDPLATQIRIYASSVTLQEVFEKILPEIAQRAGRKLSVDFDGLKAAGVPLQKIVTIPVRDESLRRALERVLNESDVKLDYRLSDDGKDLIVFAPPGQLPTSASAPPKGLEFLVPYPKLHGLSLDMSEKQFLEIVKQQELKTRKTVDGEKVQHHIALGDGHTLIVMFDKDGKCSGIQRVRGEDSSGGPPELRTMREPSFRLPGHSNITGIGFDNNSTELVAVSTYHFATIRRWDLMGMKLKSDITLSSDRHLRPFREGSFKLSGDGRRVIAATDEYVGIWETTTGKLLKKLPFPTREGIYDCWIDKLDCTSDLSVIAGNWAMPGRLTHFYDARVMIWDGDSGNLLQTVTVKNGTDLKSIDLSTDGKLLATTNGGGAKVWETSSGKLLRSFPNDNKGRKHSDPEVSHDATHNVWCVQLSPDGKQVAMGDILGVKLLDVASGKLLQLLEGPHRYGLGTLVFSKDGRLLARTGTGDRAEGDKTSYVVPIWSTQTGEKVFELHTESESGAFSDDNKQFAVGVSDWEMALAVFQLSGSAANTTQLAPESTKDKVAVGTHCRGKEAEEFIDNWKPVWGEPQLGIRYGIALTTPQRQFRVGERVPLVVFFRNASNKPLQIDTRPDFFGNTPKVVDAKGVTVGFEKIPLLGGSTARYVENLEPGEAVGPLYLNFGLGENPRPGQQNWTPYWKTPRTGKCKLTHSVSIKVAGPEAKPDAVSNEWKSGDLATGTIEFEIIDVDKTASNAQADKPAAVSLTAAELEKQIQLKGRALFFGRMELAQEFETLWPTKDQKLEKVTSKGTVRWLKNTRLTRIDSDRMVPGTGTVEMSPEQWTTGFDGVHSYWWNRPAKLVSYGAMWPGAIGYSPNLLFWGRVAIAYPQPIFGPNPKITRAARDGREEIDVVHDVPEAKLSIRYVGIVPDRGYLPTRVETRTNDRLESQTEFQDFFQPHPGVWAPKTIVWTAWSADNDANGKPIVVGRTKTTVTKLELGDDAKLQDEEFKLKLPDDVKVVDAATANAADEKPGAPVKQEPQKPNDGAKLPGRLFVNAGLRTTKDETRFTQSAIAIDPNTGSWTRLQNLSESGFTVPLSHVRVSPDGRTMLFMREKELWKCDAATGDRAERVLKKGSPAAWSPDGKTFIAVVQTNERDGQLVENWIVSMDGQKQSVLALPKGDAVEDWSADGQWLAVRSRLDSQIYLVKPDGSGRRRLADSVEYSLGHSSFSPDSQRIVYLRRQTLDDKSRFSLRTINIDGTGDREIVGEKKAGSKPDSALWTAPMAARWSPNGKHLAVVLFDHSDDGGIAAIGGNWRLAFIDADGGNLRELKLEGMLTTVLPWDGPEWRPVAPGRLPGAEPPSPQPDAAASSSKTQPESTPPSSKTGVADADKEQSATAVGTVVAPDNKPMAGIEVLVFQGGKQLEQKFTTDEKGEFRVPKVWREVDHWLTLVARDGRERLGWFDFMIHGHSDIGQKSEDGSFRLVLLPMSRTIRGRVLDESGQPLAQIPVRINQLDHEVNSTSVHWRYQKLGDEALVLGAVTDNDGRFELKLPANTFAWLGTSHPDWVEQRIRVTKVKDEVGDSKLVRAAKVAGRVIDSRTGKPLAGVMIGTQMNKPNMAESEGYVGTTDANGNYVIEGLNSGEFTIFLFKLDGPDSTLTTPAIPAATLKKGDTFQADFSLSVGRRLAGRVLDIDTGKPIAGCKVNYSGPARPSTAYLNTETNKFGEFEFFVPPGRSSLDATEGRRFGNDSTRTVDVPADGDPEPVVLKVGEETESVPGSFKIFIGPPLDRKVSLHLQQVPLVEVLESICQAVAVKLELDGDGLKSAGYTKNMVVTIDADRITLRDALAQVLKPCEKLSFTLDKDQIFVSNRQQVEAREAANKLKSQETSAVQSPDIATDGWGKELNGLRTRVTSLTEKPAVGQPLRVKIELQNIGKVERTYQSQRADPDYLLEVVGPDGKPAEFIKGGSGIPVQALKIKPDETVVLWEDVDVASMYLLANPGRYEIKLRGPDKFDVGSGPERTHPNPASNTLAVTLADGTLNDIQATFVRIRTIAPKDWNISTRGNGISNIQKSITRRGEFLLLFTKDRQADDFKLGGTIPYEYLGQTRLGHAYLAVNPQAKTEWPECVEKIREQLPPADMATGEWGKELNGLRTRVTLLTERPAVGLPLKVKIELQNIGQVDRTYRSQGANPDYSLEIVGPDGKPGEFINGGSGISAPTAKIKPDETVVLWEDVDVASMFLLANPGRYEIKLSGPDKFNVDEARPEQAHPNPTSNTLAVTLADGTLNDIQATFVRIRNIAPKDWGISTRGNSISNIQKSITRRGEFLLLFTKERQADDQKFGTMPYEYLGLTRLGHAYLATNPQAKATWPECVEKIREQLPPADTVTGEWGKELNGLRTRVTLLTEKPAVGQPLKVKIELQNVGKVERKYQSQRANPDYLLEVVGPDGKPAEFINGPLQVQVSSATIKPGETIVLWEGIDVASMFLLPKSGRYPIKLRGSDSFDADETNPDQVHPYPTSNTLSVTLVEGPLNDIQATFVSVRNIAPKDWQVSTRDNSILLISPNFRKGGVGRGIIHLVFTKEQKTDEQKLLGTVQYEPLGLTALGHAYVAASPETKTEWPECVEKIRAQLPSK